MTTLTIEVPDELLANVAHRNQLELLAREALLVRLFDQGEISSGKAAEILGVSRRAFLDLLSKYHVSEFDDEMDLEKEARIALEARIGR